MFGDTFDNQKSEQFPSKLRQLNYSSPKFVSQQKQRMSHSSKFLQGRDQGQDPFFSSTKGTPGSGPFKSKQYIIFPKIQQSIREQHINERNNAFLELASSNIHPSQLASKTLNAETLRLVYSQPYIHYQNVKRIRKISPEQRDSHVCKKSMMIPHHEGNYAMPGLPHSENRTAKLSNMSFTKMQWNQSNYNSNFALSKREQEIREYLRIARLSPEVIQQQQRMQQQQEEQQQQLQDQIQSSSENPNLKQQPSPQPLTVQSKSSKQGEFDFLTSYSKSSMNNSNNIKNINSKEIQHSPQKSITPPPPPYLQLPQE